MDDVLTLAEVRDKIKQRKIRVRDIASFCGYSTSAIYTILRGDWPYMGAGLCPTYFDRWARFHLNARIGQREG